MFETIKNYPFLKPIHDAFPDIRKECLRTTEMTPWHERVLYNFGWDVFSLHFKGEDSAEGKERCPITFDLVKQVPGLFIAGFSRLAPGCVICPHVGYTDAVLRSHLGLVCPGGASITVGGVTKEWREGEMFVFDDTQMHSASNPSGSDRIVLIVDFYKEEKVFEPTTLR